MALESNIIPFGAWLPDLPSFASPGMVRAENVIPVLGGYRSVRAPEYAGDPIIGRVLGAHWAITGGGSETAIFAGSPNQLWRQNNSSDWDIVSKPPGYIGVERWEFASFGDRMIAVTGGYSPQYYDVGSSTTFDDLPNAPTASAVGLVRDFVVLGDISGLGENYIQWSGFNDTEAWTPSRTTQSDFQQLASNGGKVQQIVSGSDGHIFLENSVYRMRYIGPPRIFQLDEIGPGRGTPAPQSVIRIGPFIFHYDNDGFHQFDTRNSSFTAIGQNKVDFWFRENVPPVCIRMMQATVDPLNKIVAWTYCVDPSSINNDQILLYQYEIGQWSLLSLPNDTLARVPSPSANLDELDDALSPGGGVPGNVDDQSISVDSGLFSGGALDFKVFGTNHRIGSLTGDPLDAHFRTSEFSVRGNRRIVTNRQRPQIEGLPAGANGTVYVTHRDNLGDILSLSAPALMDDGGNTFVRVRSRYQHYDLTITGGFRNVTGIEVFSRVG